MPDFFYQNRPDIASVKLSPSPYTNRQCGCLTCGVGNSRAWAAGGNTTPEKLSAVDFRYLVDVLDYLPNGALLWASVNKLPELQFIWRQHSVGGDFATNRRNQHRTILRNVMDNRHIPGKTTYLLLEDSQPNNFGSKHWLNCLALSEGAYQVYDTWNNRIYDLPVKEVVGYAILAKK